jgi:hypothetical protein
MRGSTPSMYVFSVPYSRLHVFFYPSLLCPDLYFYFFHFFPVSRDISKQRYQRQIFATSHNSECLHHLLHYNIIFPSFYSVLFYRSTGHCKSSPCRCLYRLSILTRNIEVYFISRLYSTFQSHLMIASMFQFHSLFILT